MWWCVCAWERFFSLSGERGVCETGVHREGLAGAIYTHWKLGEGRITHYILQW